MPEITESIVIDRPRQEVWEFLADPDNATLFQTNLVEFEPLTQPPLHVGSKARSTVKVAGKRVESTSEVTDLEEGRTYAVRSLEAPIDWTFRYTLEDADGGTRVEFHQETAPIGGFFGRLGDAVVVKMYSRDVRSNLENLKALLEAR